MTESSSDDTDSESNDSFGINVTWRQDDWQDSSLQRAEIGGGIGFRTAHDEDAHRQQDERKTDNDLRCQRLVEYEDAHTHGRERLECAQDGIERTADLLDRHDQRDV